MQQQNILFDLDGTLTDPRLGITRSIQYALAKLGIDEPDLARLEHFIGPPLLQAFMQFYRFDDAKAWEAREIARHFAFDQHFKVIYGSELDGTRTNKVELIRHLLDEEGLDPAQTLMIGDRKHDLIGARSNGLQAVAVGYGFGSREELMAEEPAYHFATLAEMHQAFIKA